MACPGVCTVLQAWATAWQRALSAGSSSSFARPWQPRMACRAAGIFTRPAAHSRAVSRACRGRDSPGYRSSRASTAREDTSRAHSTATRRSTPSRAARKSARPALFSEKRMAFPRRSRSRTSPIQSMAFSLSHFFLLYHRARRRAKGGTGRRNPPGRPYSRPPPLVLQGLLCYDIVY